MEPGLSRMAVSGWQGPRYPHIVEVRYDFVLD
jgi:hypothetical protein